MSMRETVYETIKEHGPITDREVADKLGVRPVDVAPCITRMLNENELMLAGFAKSVHGYRRVRRTRVRKGKK